MQASPPREPAFNAPWPALVLTLALIAAFFFQSRLGVQAVAEQLGFSPADLARGRWDGLLTSLFVHGSWPHVLMNAGGALAFGSAVSRRLGVGALGAALFMAFFLVTGVLASLGFFQLHPSGYEVLVGASGGVSGLMGGAARLIGQSEGRLNPLLSRPVLGFGAAWLAVNLLIAVVGSAPGTGGAAVAWEAHLAGFAAGVLLIGLFVRLVPRPEPVPEPWAQ